MLTALCSSVPSDDDDDDDDDLPITMIASKKSKPTVTGGRYVCFAYFFVFVNVYAYLRLASGSVVDVNKMSSKAPITPVPINKRKKAQVPFVLFI